MAAWTDATRYIDGRLECNWNKDGSTWTDESSRLLSASGQMQTLELWQMAGGTAVQPSWTANFAMRNASDRYSSTNTSSPIYANISGNQGHGIPIRFSMGLDDGGFSYTRIFTGYIDDISIGSTRNDRATFLCFDNSHPLMQDKVTTTMYQGQRVDQWLTQLRTEVNGSYSTSFDDGLTVYPYCWADSENAWSEMCQAVFAEAGVLYFALDGTLTFENAETWAKDSRHSSSQHTFSVSRIQDIMLDFDWRTVYNEVIVEYSPRVQAGAVELYSLSERATVQPGQTETFDARLRYPGTVISTPVANEDYHIITATGTDLTGDMTVSLTKSAQQVTISIENTHAFRTAIVHDFRLVGLPLIGFPALQETLQATDSDIGDPTSATAKTFRVRDNPYVQTKEQAKLLVNILRDRLKVGRLSYPIREANAIPDLIPGDRVTVAETDSEISDDGFIKSINWKYSGGAYKADYNIVSATNWFPHSDYFVLGTSTLADAGSDKAFY